MLDHRVCQVFYKIKQQTRVRLYKSLIKSILLYNCGTWGLTQQQEEKLDAFHQRQLRRIIGVRYPTKITNAKLYEKCQEKPMSMTIKQARWKLFGHILRRDKDIPANKAMEFYFAKKPSDKNFRGHKRTTLPTTLAKDLDKLYLHSQRDHTYCRHLQLRNSEDLENLRTIAQDRETWHELCEEVMKAGQAEMTVVISAKDH